jgi:hypothetical protein
MSKAVPTGMKSGIAIQFGQSFCLLPKAIAEPPLAGLDGDVMSEPCIASLPDFDHPASTRRGGDLIRPRWSATATDILNKTAYKVLMGRGVRETNLSVSRILSNCPAVAVGGKLAYRRSAPGPKLDGNGIRGPERLTVAAGPGPSFRPTSEALSGTRSAGRALYVLNGSCLSRSWF